MSDHEEECNHLTEEEFRAKHGATIALFTKDEEAYLRELVTTMVMFGVHMLDAKAVAIVDRALEDRLGEVGIELVADYVGSVPFLEGLQKYLREGAA